MSEAGHRPPRPVTGTKQGEGIGGGHEHSRFFDDAFEDALEKATKPQGEGGGEWPAGDYLVTVTFEANVEVRNPGGVVEYRVTLS